MELCEALDAGNGDVIAFTGGGGKTTALYHLGAELASRGVATLLCGTTRFTPPEGEQAPNLVLVETAADLRRAVTDAQTWPLTAATGWGSKGRLLPVEPRWINALHAAWPDLAIAIEADGSAMRPFKAPGEHEPVVPSSATLVVAVAGLDAIGRPLDETHVHRPERVAALTGLAPGVAVPAEAMATVLAHPQGGRKGVPAGSRWTVLLNKADTPERRSTAERVAGMLQPGAERVVIAQLKRVPPVLAVLHAAKG